MLLGWFTNLKPDFTPSSAAYSPFQNRPKPALATLGSRQVNQVLRHRHLKPTSWCKTILGICSIPKWLEERWKKWPVMTNPSVLPTRKDVKLRPIPPAAQLGMHLFSLKDDTSGVFKRKSHCCYSIISLELRRKSHHEIRKKRLGIATDEIWCQITHDQTCY